MLALREMIKKFLLFRYFSSSTSSLNPNASSKVLPPTDLQLKATNRWNQSDLGYFDSHLDTKTHGVSKVVLIGKDIYYRNVVLFVQRIQNLVTFKGAALVKTNIPTSLREFTLK